MKYLVDPHGYFESRTSLSFFKGLVAVFFTGGFTFLIALESIVWMLPVSSHSFIVLMRNIGIYTLGYMFFGAFIWWAGTAFIVYIGVKVYGVGMSYFDALSMTGIGFIPFLIGVTAELFITTYYLFTHPPSTAPLTSHIVLEGVFGWKPAVIVFAIRTVTLLWAGNIWLAGTHQMGRLTPLKSVLTAGTATVLLWTGLIGVVIF